MHFVSSFIFALIDRKMQNGKKSTEKRVQKKKKCVNDFFFFGAKISFCGEKSANRGESAEKKERKRGKVQESDFFLFLERRKKKRQPITIKGKK